MRSDADVMRFIREPQNRRGIRQLGQTCFEPLGERTNRLLRDNRKIFEPEFAGWCGLWQLKETGEFEVGYAVAKDFWGKGYATEAAKEFLIYAFEKLEFEKIVGGRRSPKTRLHGA